VLPHVRFRLPRIPFEDVSQFGSSCFLRLADPNVPNAPVQRRAAQRAVRCNWLLGSLMLDCTLNPVQQLPGPQSQL